MDTTHTFSWVTIALLLPGITGCAWPGKTAKNGAPLNPFADSQVVYADGEQSADDDYFPNKKIEDPERLKLTYAKWMEEVGNRDEARNHYQSVLKARPKDVEAMVGLARLDLQEDKPSEARHRLETALQLNPKSADAHLEMGLLQIQSQDWDAAVKSLSAASAARPEDRTIRHQLGVALVHTGEIDAAQTQFAQSVGPAAGHYNTALILKDLDQMADAEQQLRLALIKDPKLTEAQRWLAEIQKQRSLQGPVNSETVSGPPPIEPAVVPISYRNLGPMGTVENVPAVYIEDGQVVGSKHGAGHSRPISSQE